MSEYEDVPQDVPQVRYEAAFAWTCPNCAHRNYEEGEVVEANLTHEERVKIAAENDCEPEDVVGEWVHIPVHSTCAICTLLVTPAPDEFPDSLPSQD